MGLNVKGLLRPSYVVPFWVVYYSPLTQKHNRPKKGLHRSVGKVYRV